MLRLSKKITLYRDEKLYWLAFDERSHPLFCKILVTDLILVARGKTGTFLQLTPTPPSKQFEKNNNNIWFDSTLVFFARQTFNWFWRIKKICRHKSNFFDLLRNKKTWLALTLGLSRLFLRKMFFCQINLDQSFGEIKQIGIGMLWLLSVMEWLL